MKQLNFLLLFLIAINIKAQAVKHQALNCKILVDINYEGNINVYDNTGKIVKKLKNNIKKEDFISLTIIGTNDSMYNVIANQAFEGVIAKGWIKKNNPHIGIYVRNYDSPLSLYQKPEEKSKIQSTIKHYYPILFHFKDCENNWLYIYIVIANKKFEGWLSPDMQCANSYTTCN